MERPDLALQLPGFHVRNRSVQYYYQRLTLVAKHSGHVNLQFGLGFMFSSSVSVNRVFRYVVPGYSP